MFIIDQAYRAVKEAFHIKRKCPGIEETNWETFKGALIKLWQNWTRGWKGEYVTPYTRPWWMRCIAKPLWETCVWLYRDDNFIARLIQLLIGFVLYHGIVKHWLGIE